MEELKILVEMVASLPQMALWVIAFFFIYKVMVIGSIYGVIRFCVGKFHDVLIKERPPTKVIFTLDDTCIDQRTEIALKKSLNSLKDTGCAFIHYRDIATLDKAIKMIKNKGIPNE